MCWMGAYLRRLTVVFSNNLGVSNGLLLLAIFLFLCFLVIRRMNRVSNVWRRELCGVKKGLDERIDEGVLRWLDYLEKIENDRIDK